MTKEAFLAAVRDEINRITFLAGKVEENDLAHRLSESARTTKELLQYLSVAAIVPAKAMLTGNYEHYAALQERAAAVSLSGFADAMRAQEAEITALVESIPDADWTSGISKLPWGAERATCDAMVESALAFLIAYRMQLFLHLKSHGRDDYKTYECWAAMDDPKRVGASS